MNPGEHCVNTGVHSDYNCQKRSILCHCTKTKIQHFLCQKLTIWKVKPWSTIRVDPLSNL